MNPQKTIVIVAPYFPPYGGGLERYAYEMGERLYKDYRSRIVVITSGKRYGSDTKEEINGLTVYRLSYRWKFSNTPFSLRWFRTIRRILKSEDPDIINIHMPVPGIGDIAGLFANKKPIIVTYHAGSMQKKRLSADAFIWLYEHGPLRHLLRKANRIICSSDFVRFEFLKPFLYKSVTITSGVDSELFKPDQTKKATIPTLLFVAGLSRGEQHKGLKTLLNAVQIIRKTLPDIRLVIVGDGNMKGEYQAYTRQLGLDDAVDFKGRLTGRELSSAYQSADVFALPSSNEGFGMVILEAMACELPVVSTNIGGIPLITENGKTGFLVEPHDPGNLALKILDLLHDPAHANAFGRVARAKVIKEFDWRPRAERYEQVLMQALGKHVPHIPRITVVASYFYPKIGGLENYAYNLAKGLNASGKYRVSIITSNHEGGGYKQEIIDGMTVHRLPIWIKVSNTPINLTWSRWIKDIFVVEQPDLVHLHSPVPFMADLAARAAKDRPVVLTYHSGSMLKGKWPVDILIGLYENTFLAALFRRADAVVAISQEFAKRKFPQFAGKTYFIPTGVDLNRFKKTPLPTGIPTVTFVGRIEHTSSWKGIEQLLQAMALVIKKRPDARLELVGGGDAIPHYQDRAQELGISASVIFSGPQIGEDLVDAYRRANVIVLPSTSDSEAFSIALVEAMACGRPIIGTNIGGTPQVIDHEKNGLLVPPSNPEELGKAIERILGDRQLATRLADFGAARAQNFAWEIQTKKYSELFKKFV